MDLAKIYQLLQQAVDFKHFMQLNNEIHKNEEQSELTNNREGSKLHDVIKGKNKIFNLINKKTKNNQ
jgi:hypothetical protein